MKAWKVLLLDFIFWFLSGTALFLYILGGTWLTYTVLETSLNYIGIGSVWAIIGAIIFPGLWFVAFYLRRKMF